jgi:hypothetical protein
MRATLAKFAVPAVLYVVLGVLVVIPIVMIAVASFLNVPPFSGAGALAFTTANYGQLWNSSIGMAAFNTFTIALGGSAIALVIGCGPVVRLPGGDHAALRVGARRRGCMVVAGLGPLRVHQSAAHRPEYPMAR